MAVNRAHDVMNATKTMTDNNQMEQVLAICNTIDIDLIAFSRVMHFRIEHSRRKLSTTFRIVQMLSDVSEK